MDSAEILASFKKNIGVDVFSQNNGWGWRYFQRCNHEECRDEKPQDRGGFFQKKRLFCENHTGINASLMKI